MSTDQRSLLQYHRRITSAMDHIQTHINNATDEGLQLDAVANAACMSPFHFHKVFKVVVGETVADYTRRLKLERAAGLFFYFKQASVTDVAIALGFSSSQNLAKSFKNEFAMTPSDIKALADVDHLMHLIQHHRKNGNATTEQFSYSDTSHVTRWKSMSMKSAMSTCNQDTLNKLGPLQLFDLPARQVIYHRLIGPYGDGLQAASADLQAFCARNGIAVGNPVVINWDNPKITEPAQCRTDVCLTLMGDCKTPSPYNIQTIVPQTHAIMRGLFDFSFDFGSVWQQLFDSLFSQGMTPADKPCYKVMHLKNSDPAKGIFDVSFCQAVETV
ncbi:Transposon Tn10 TetD protein [BD1-7 clade bacterium]|uniref:Transposon Tn10 TetD protein n=1 Tax=BD1-7 clade bacterium TaxID=2029982 RepID=A0A5S9NQ99_9GAMM|nr:Transposon Tn10 TetD protein [BD1-7 clade bacterium]